MNVEIARKASVDLVDRLKFLVLGTNDERGYPEARTLFNLRSVREKAHALVNGSDGGMLRTFIGTNTSSRKVAQLKKDTRCCLYFTDEASFEGLCLKGRAYIEDSAAVRDGLWTPEWDMYYPGGKDGGDYTILRFEPESGRYYRGLEMVDFDCGDKG